MIETIEEFAECAIREHVKANIENYFSFCCYQQDVASWDFIFNGTLKREAEFEDEWFGRTVYVEAKWVCASLDEDIKFDLDSVDVVITECDEDGNAKEHNLNFDHIFS